MRRVGADEVEHDVGAAAAGQVADGIHRVDAVDDMIRAELRRELPPPLVRVDRDDVGRRELAHELDRDVPDSADARHGGGRAGAEQRRELADGVVRGEPGVGVRRDRGGLDAAGSFTSDRSSTSTYSAKPPSTESPVNSWRSQCMSLPRRHGTHSPQLYGG